MNVCPFFKDFALIKNFVVSENLDEQRDILNKLVETQIITCFENSKHTVVIPELEEQIMSLSLETDNLQRNILTSISSTVTTILNAYETHKDQIDSAIAIAKKLLEQYQEFSKTQKDDQNLIETLKGLFSFIFKI